MAHKPFGRACPRPPIERITQRAIYSVREVAERAGMTEAEVRKLASARGVKLHHQSNADYLRAADINTHMTELHERACRIEGRDE